MRIKRGKTVRAKHKKLRKATKGFRTLRRKSIKKAREALMKAGQYAYRDRRAKKRTFRSLWINRINAAVTGMGINYSRFTKALKDKKIEVDRKVLAQLAVQHPQTFKRIVEQAVK